MSAPPDTACVRTPLIKFLISKDFESRPISSSLVPREGHPCGVPPPLRGGSPSRISRPPKGASCSPLRAGPPHGVLPHTPHPASAARRPKAGGVWREIQKIDRWARPQAAQGPVGMWAKAGQPVGKPCGRAVGRRSLSTGRPSGLSTGRAKRASRWPQAIVHISTGRESRGGSAPFGQGRSPPQPPEAGTTLR